MTELEMTEMEPVWSKVRNDHLTILAVTKLERSRDRIGDDLIGAGWVNFDLIDRNNDQIDGQFGQVWQS